MSQNENPRNIITAAREVMDAKKEGAWHPWLEVEPHTETMQMAASFAKSVLNTEDMLALLSLDCRDGQILSQWETCKACWRKEGGNPTDKSLPELQALFEWNARFIGLLDNQLNG